MSKSLCTNLTEKFLNGMNEVSAKRVPDSVVEKLKLLLLDYIGVTLAGAAVQRNRVYDILAEETENGNIPIIGMKQCHTMKNAVFFNGLSGHTLDFDDGVNEGIIHLGVPIFSALLPVMYRVGIQGKKMLQAAVVGYETSFTLAASIQPEHKKLGGHATGTCGTAGVAMSLAEALDFDFAQRKNALSIAAVSTFGFLKVLEDGSELKPYNAAKAALMGYIAAQMAKAGYAGPDDVLGGDHGFLKIMSGEANRRFEQILRNGTYAVEKTYIKPYAACRYCHPAIEASIMLRNKYNIPDDEIRQIEVKTYELAVYRHDHTQVRGSASAKMSIPYSVAVSYISGKASIYEYSSKAVENKKILTLMRKVRVYEEPEFTKAFPAKTMAEVKLITNSGKEYTEISRYPKGEPENPLTIDEIKEKYYTLASMSGKTEKQLKEIEAVVFNFEDRYKELYTLLR